MISLDKRFFSVLAPPRPSITVLFFSALRDRYGRELSKASISGQLFRADGSRRYFPVGIDRIGNLAGSERSTSIIISLKSFNGPEGKSQFDSTQISSAPKPVEGYSIKHQDMLYTIAVYPLNQKTMKVEIKDVEEQLESAKVEISSMSRGRP
ncbi:hypothetical protein IAS59_006506 [Cryptococcus gattii]